MNAHTNFGFRSHSILNRRALLGPLALILVIAAALSLSGCVGVTGAATPAPNSTPGSGTSAGTLTASAATLSFGSVAPGSTSAQTLTLSNTGTAAVTISQATVTGTGFSLAGTMTSLSIAAGQKQSFQIDFSPKSAGSASGTISIASDASNGPVAVSLIGTGGTSALTISAQPQSQGVKVGQVADFAVTATGSGTLAYQWKKNGAAISGATSATYVTPATTSADNGAQFSVVVTDAAQSVTSSAATLTVTASAVAPSITTQPAGKAVTAGQTATFTVAASGTSPFTYQWTKNGAAIGGATGVSYTTPATTVSDNNAKFAVTISNSVGSAASNAATLTVTAASVAPTITAQPTSKSVTTGQTATFSVAATGTGTLSYQWNRGGAAISGATSSSYTTPATTSADNGAQFTVTVTNSVGSATSNAATLTVNATATLVLNASQTSLNFSSVNIGSNHVLPVVFTNAGTGNVTISGVTISGAGYTASGVSSGQIVTPGNTATLNVTFTPSSTGLLSGGVTVSSNAANSPATVTLSGTGVQPVTHSVTLTWTASTSVVSGYNVYRSSVSGGPYTKLNSAPVAPTTYVDSTVQASTTYFYVVTSVDASNVESAYSTEVSVTVP
jgi:hypothetical protein